MRTRQPRARGAGTIEKDAVIPDTRERPIEATVEVRGAHVDFGRLGLVTYVVLRPYVENRDEDS